MPPLPAPSWIDAFLADQWPQDRRLDRTIHPDDEMYDYSRHLRHGAPGLGAVEYFRSGLLAHQVLRQVLEWRFGSVGATPSLLDFASGFGRTTRFLVGELSPERVWIADIKPDAVAFQRERFGVNGHVTTHDPSSLPVRPRFAIVFAASLFTHLPERTFVPWLKRLYDACDQAGLLVVSTLGEGALAWRTMPSSGLLFERLSESGVLDRDDYGTTWVSESYLRSALASIGAGRVTCRRYPRALWHQQDVWLVATRSTDLDGLSLDPGPVGILERAELGPGGRVTLAGWAGTATPAEALPTIAVSIPGRGAALTVECAHARPDARALFQLASAGGWGAQLVLAGDVQSDEPLLVKARSQRGRELVLFLGSLEAAILATRVDQLTWEKALT